MPHRSVDVYSLALAAALAAAGLGLAAAVAGRARALRSSALDRVALGASLAAVLLTLTSAIVHYRTGHAAGSPAPLTAPGFLAAHPAFAVAALAAAAALRILRRGP